VITQSATGVFITDWMPLNLPRLQQGAVEVKALLYRQEWFDSFTIGSLME